MAKKINFSINLSQSLSYWLESVQFSHSVMSDSSLPHDSQHARPPCPSPNPRVHSNSCPSSQWCHPAISSYVIPSSSCPQSLPASESFPMSQLFAWGGQSTGLSALASFLPRKSQGWSPLERTGWTRLPHPWDSPGEITGGGCHFLLQCMKVKSLSCVWLFATPWAAAY